MTPDERNLIMGLFDRMRSHGAIEKEREAEALINGEVRKIPDSAYMLVQSVLVNEQIVASQQERVEQLETRVRELEARAPAAQPSGGGGFLGGLFGGGSRPQPTSVPTSRPAVPANSPWGQPAPQYQQGGYQPGGMPMQQAAPQRAGGGFMAQAMTTAAGVAGGMLAANAISNMMNSHKSGSGTQNTGFDQAAEDSKLDAQVDQEIAQQDAYNSDNDPGTSGASDSGGGWSGGGDSDA
jgi:uncharacterized protein